MIYFMRADEDGPVKIGWSKDPIARSRQVRPSPITKMTIIRLLDGPLWGERWLHARFSRSKISHEWFGFDPEMLTVELPAAEPDNIPRTFPLQAKTWTGRDAHKTGRTEQIVARIPLEDAAAFRAEAKARSLTTSSAVKQAIQRWLGPRLSDVEVTPAAQPDLSFAEFRRQFEALARVDPPLPTEPAPRPAGSLLKGQSAGRASPRTKP